MSNPNQPDALRLADALAYCDNSVASQAVRELRRLHEALGQIANLVGDCEHWAASGDPQVVVSMVEDFMAGNALRRAAPDEPIFGKSNLVTTNEQTIRAHLGNGLGKLLIQYATADDAEAARIALWKL